MADQPRTPDGKGTLTIYTDKFENVGSVELNINTNPVGKQPKYYGKIHIKPEWLGKFKTANISVWTKEQQDQMFNNGEQKQ